MALANWHHDLPRDTPEPAEVTRIAWTRPPRAELRPLPRTEPDPPMRWPVALGWWALGFTGTLTALHAIVAWIGELG